jgi:hypothetical protein
VVQQEVGVAEGLPQHIGIERSVAVPAPARRFDADERKGRIEPANDGEDASPLIRGP